MQQERPQTFRETLYKYENNPNVTFVHKKELKVPRGQTREEKCELQMYGVGLCTVSKHPKGKYAVVYLTENLQTVGGAVQPENIPLDGYADMFRETAKVMHIKTSALTTTTGNDHDLLQLRLLEALNLAKEQPLFV